MGLLGRSYSYNIECVCVWGGGRKGRGDSDDIRIERLDFGMSMFLHES